MKSCKISFEILKSDQNPEILIEILSKKGRFWGDFAWLLTPRRAAKQDTQNTSVLFMQTKILPILAFHILRSIAPVCTKFIYFILCICTTLHTKF